MPSNWLDELFGQIAQNGADAVPSESVAPADGAFNPARDSQAFSDYGQTFFGGDNGEFGRPATDLNVQPAVPVQQQEQAPSLALMAPAQAAPLPQYNPGKAQPGFLDAAGKKVDIARNPDGSINYSDPRTIDSLMRLVLGAGSVASALTRSKTTPQNFQSATDMRAALLGSNNNWTPQQQATADAFFNTPMQTGVNRQRMYAAQMPSSLTPARNYAEGGAVGVPDDVMQELQQALEKRRAYGWSRVPDAQAITQQDREMFGKMAPSAQLARLRAMLKGVQTPVMPAASMTGRAPEPYAAGGSVGNALGWGDWGGWSGGSAAPAASVVAQTPAAAPAVSNVAARDSAAPAAALPTSTDAAGHTWFLGQPEYVAAAPSPAPAPVGKLSTINSNLPLAADGYYQGYDSSRPGSAPAAPYSATEMATARPGWWSPYQMTAPENYAAWSLSRDNSMNPNAASAPRYTVQGRLVDAQGNDITDTYLAAHGMAAGGGVGGAPTDDGALGYIRAHTGGQDDVVPINAAGGEYMFDAETVSALGDGNNAAGAAKLDELRRKLRQEKRATPVDQIPDKTKPLKHYIKGL